MLPYVDYFGPQRGLGRQPPLVSERHRAYDDRQFNPASSRLHNYCGAPMASYGNTNSQVAFTGWTSTLANGPANVPGAAGSVQFNGLSQQDYRLAGTLNIQAMRKLRALLYSVIGAAPGGMATAPYARVLAQQSLNNPFALGGLVPIESTNYVNRASVAADVTALKALLDRRAGSVAYVSDLSGNGSGRMTGAAW